MTTTTDTGQGPRSRSGSQTSEGAQELQPRTVGTELLREAGAVLRMSESEAETLERTSQSLRFLLCNKTVAAKVKTWLLSGSSWGETLAALHGTGGRV